MNRFYPFIKRGLDVLLSAGALMLLSPVFLTVSLIIKLDSPGPVLFRQKRVGKGCTYFTIYKFRTMKTDAPSNLPTHLLKNADSCITKVGAVLRRFSIDELPQLFNVLRGQMSLIGPRPALWNQDDLIQARQMCGANDIRPGLTGWAQINGRDELKISEKVAYDGYYTHHMGFKMDVKCFFGTIASVLKQDGVVEGGTGQIQQREKEESKA